MLYNSRSLKPKVALLIYHSLLLLRQKIKILIVFLMKDLRVCSNSASVEERVAKEKLHVRFPLALFLYLLRFFVRN